MATYATPDLNVGRDMSPREISEVIVSRFPGVIAKISWGETAFFYNPDHSLPNGAYFCTIKDHDGKNDGASKLDRQGVFRVAIGLPSDTYVGLFGAKPSRPQKGGVVDTGHDFTRVNELMPHPIYAWMGWVQMLSPAKRRFADILPLIEMAHQAAVVKFLKTSAKKNRRTPENLASQRL